VALFLNFSLYASRLIIDFGNITARVFYKSMSVPYTDAQQLPVIGGNPFLLAEKFYTKETDKDGHKVYPYRSISAPFNSFVKPQSIMGAKTYKAWKAKDGGNLIKFLFLAMVIIVYMVMIAAIFFQASFMFISRIV